MSTKLRIAELPADLRAAGWFLHNRGNAVYGFNTRWWMESPLFALNPALVQARQADRSAARPARPGGGVDIWLRQATEDIQPLLSALEQALPDPEQRGRLRFRLGYWERRIIVMASVALADWRLAIDEDGWHHGSSQACVRDGQGVSCDPEMLARARLSHGDARRRRNRVNPGCPPVPPLPSSSPASVPPASHCPGPRPSLLLYRR